MFTCLHCGQQTRFLARKLARSTCEHYKKEFVVLDNVAILFHFPNGTDEVCGRVSDFCTDRRSVLSPSQARSSRRIAMRPVTFF